MPPYTVARRLPPTVVVDEKSPELTKSNTLAYFDPPESIFGLTFSRKGLQNLKPALTENVIPVISFKGKIVNSSMVRKFRI